MDVLIIITIVITSCIAIERIIKHIKKSKCCNSEIIFDTNTSAPDFTNLLKKV